MEGSADVITVASMVQAQQFAREYPGQLVRVELADKVDVWDERGRHAGYRYCDATYVGQVEADENGEPRVVVVEVKEEPTDAPALAATD